MAVPAHILLREEGEAPPARRGFLKTLITAPIAALATHKLILPGPAGPAVEPITNALLLSYNEWLFFERRLLCREMYPGSRDMERTVPINTGASDYHWSFPKGELPSVERVPPSTRAALVLDAVGCNWRRS